MPSVTQASPYRASSMPIPAPLERTTGGPGRLASARNAAMRSVLRILLAVDCDALGRFSCLGGFWEDDGEHAVLE
jgi:hypothetical protein